MDSGLPPCSPQIDKVTPLRPFRSMTNNAPDIAAFARRRGVRLGSVIDRERWVRPFLVAGLPLFVWNSSAMDFPHEPPADVEYLGPMVPAEATMRPNRLYPASLWARSRSLWAV